MSDERERAGSGWGYVEEWIEQECGEVRAENKRLRRENAWLRSTAQYLCAEIHNRALPETIERAAGYVEMALADALAGEVCADDRRLVEALWDAYCLRCQEPLPLAEIEAVESQVFSLMKALDFNPVRMEWGKDRSWLPPGVDVAVLPIESGEND